ncbi:HNH endonuclease [Brevibacillus brevis]|nr:HNH endonuclease [Lysinibacillus sp. SDF0063]TQR29405.1 HNH endonuclease [Lysinibacillus sp. SDF0063]
MAQRPNKPCSKPGCPALTRERYCQKHTEEQVKTYNRHRGSSSERGYDARWRKARTHFLSLNPLCVHCRIEGKAMAATVVDHIKPHKGDKILFWDRTNWQALCASCHSKKTAKEDGGFGNDRN